MEKGHEGKLFLMTNNVRVGPGEKGASEAREQVEEELACWQSTWRGSNSA